MFGVAQMSDVKVKAVVFDVGRVLYQWRLGALFEKIVSDPARLAKLLGEVVTEEWHFDHDRGRQASDSQMDSTLPCRIGRCVDTLGLRHQRHPNL